jgi:hypothetical protein
MMGGAKMPAVGSKLQVWNGNAKHTSGGLTRKDLMRTKHGRIVSRRKHAAGQKAIKNLRKAGYIAKKGTFKLFSKKRGGSTSDGSTAGVPLTGTAPSTDMGSSMGMGSTTTPSTGSTTGTGSTGVVSQFMNLGSSMSGGRKSRKNRKNRKNMMSRKNRKNRNNM